MLKQETAMEGHSLDIGNNASVDNSKQNTTQLVEICPLVPADLPCLGENIPPPRGSAQDSGKKPQVGMLASCIVWITDEARWILEFSR